MDISTEMTLMLGRMVSDIESANGRYWMQGNGMLIRIAELKDNGVAVAYECDNDFQDLMPFNITMRALANSFCRTAPPSVLAALARTVRVRPNYIDEARLSEEENPLFSPYELTAAERRSAVEIATLKVPKAMNPKDRLDVAMDGYLTQIHGDVLQMANNGPMQALALGYAVISTMINHTPYRFAVSVETDVFGFYTITFYRIGSSSQDYPVDLKATLKRYTGELFDIH